MKREETRGIQIRFPYQMYEALKRRAGKDHRSLNGEVIASLQYYIEAITAIEKAIGGSTSEGFGDKADA